MALQEAATTVLKSSPSPFSTLLRRSKFASFDTQIAQVYTTYDGDAHRGNWGLKRPLPLRRRHAYITLDNVDSRYQQTEWKSAENEARFVKRFDELDVDVKYELGKEWDKRMGTNAGLHWRVDSEFCPRAEEEVITEESKNPLNGPHHKGPKSLSSPNIYAMSVGEFKRHLKKLRQLRPKFKEYLESQGSDDPRVRGKSMYEIVQTRSNHHVQFIGALTGSIFDRPGSRVIEGIPHRSAGLVYTHISPMQTLFSTKPQPGIVLHTSMFNDRAYKRSKFLASFAGMVVSLPKSEMAKSERGLLDVGVGGTGIQKDDMESSFTEFRIKKAPTMVDTPTVVGRKKEGLEGAKIAAEVVSANRLDHGRSNPYIPGSREYIFLREAAMPKGSRFSPMSATQRTRWTRPVKDAIQNTTPEGQLLLNKLSGMVAERNNSSI